MGRKDDEMDKNDKVYLLHENEALKRQKENALAEAVSVLYLDDSSDYSTALWKIVEILGGDDAVNLLLVDEQAAYDKYAKKGGE